MEEMIDIMNGRAHRARLAGAAVKEGLKEDDVDSAIGVIYDKLKTMKRTEIAVMFKTKEEAIAASHDPDISRVENLVRNLGDYIVGE